MKFIKRDWLVLTGFIFISVICFLPLIKTHQIYGSGDLLFHLNRMVGFSESIQHGTLSYRSFDTLSGLGSSVNFFYPFVYILGFSSLFVLFPNSLVFAFYLGEIIVLVFTLMIAYWCMLTFSSGSKKRSIVFALLYGFSGYFMYLLSDQYVLGEAFAYVFIPVAFLGFYNIFFGDKKKWYILAMGISLLLYAHMLTTLLTIITFILILILALITRRLKINMSTLISLGKAILLTLGLTAIIYLPFLYQFRQTTIITTIKQGLLFLNGLGTNLLMAINGEHQNIGIFSVLAFVLIIIKVFQKKGDLNLRIGLFGLLVFLIGTSIFPWYNLSIDAQALIQFPYRVFGIATVFIMTFLSKVLIEFFGREHKNYYLLILFLSIFSIVSFWSKTSEERHELEDKTFLQQNNNRNRTKEILENNFVTNSDGIESIRTSRHDYIGVIDYAPEEAWQPNNRKTLLSHKVLFNNKVIESSNRYYFNRISNKINLTTSGNVDVPVFSYGNEEVKVDGKDVKHTQSERGSVQVNQLKEGIHTVTVSYKTPNWIILLWIGTIIMWLLLGIWRVFDNRK